MRVSRLWPDARRAVIGALMRAQANRAPAQEQEMGHGGLAARTARDGTGQPPRQAASGVVLRRYMTLPMNSTIRAPAAAAAYSQVLLSGR